MKRQKQEGPRMSRHMFEFSPAMSHEFETVNFGGDGVNIPLHLSLRGSRNEVILNNMRDGVWGEERIGRFEYDASGTHVLDVRIVDRRASIYIDGIPLFVDTPVPIVKTIEIIETNLTPFDPLSQSNKSIRVAGEEFEFLTLSRDGQQYIARVFTPFLSSHVIGSKDGLFVDMSNTDGAVATILRAIYPKALIVLIAEEYARVNFRPSDDAPGQLVALTPNEAVAAFAHASGASSTSPVSALGALIADYLRDEQLAAIFASNLFSHADKDLLNSFTPFLTREAVAVCASEVDLTKTMSVLALRQGHRDLMIKFLGQPWLWRKDRLGVTTYRADRLDVGVAMYNTGQFIIPCLESLLLEERDDVRVILVDDGSTDDSLAIVEKMFGRHPRLELVTKVNGGCASARNYARLVSDAKYISFVDADDFVDPHMFPLLLDLARVSGNEIVQGGFVFHDSTTGENKSSYELEQFKDWGRIPFKGTTCFRAHAQQLIAGQPTIWRRVYRRDFLDNRNLWFPEHIRAFDDMVFHLMSVYLARDVLTLDGAHYYYRQHAAQDIKQGDERHFYELEMYRIIAKRAIREGWNDFQMFTPCIVNTINWSVESIREDLIIPFLNGAAELWAQFERAFGDHVFPHSETVRVQHSDFLPFLKRERAKLTCTNIGYAAAFVDGMLSHPSTLIMGRKMQTALTT